jgi:predicted phage tail protein
MGDGASDMVQLFTVSNIFQDSFSEEFLALTERANSVEITFYNEEKDYQQDVITVYDPSYDETDRLVNPAQKTLYGCTTASRALREGRYLMRLTNHLIRTVAIEVDVDAIACQVGSVIGIQHDIPQWGVGGRVISYNAETLTMTLDKEVDLVAGKSYTVMCRLVDEANVREVFDYKTFVAGNTETTNTIVFSEAWTIAPEAETLYTFGETGKSFKLFRVLNITRSQELKRTIHGLEYIPEVYDEDEPIPPQITYAPLATQEPVINLRAVPNYVISKTGTILPEINISWKPYKGSAPDYYMVFAYGESGQEYSATRVNATNYTFSNVKMDMYSVKVTAVYGGLIKENVVVNIDVTEKTSPPNVVQNLVLAQDASYPHTLHITWDAVANYDLAGYELRTGAETWDASATLQNDLIVGTSYDLTVMTSGTKYIHIKAKDSSGNYSIDATTCSIIMVSVEPDSITGFEVEQLL